MSKKIETSNASSTTSYDVSLSDATIHATIQSYISNKQDFAKIGAYLLCIKKYLEDHPQVGKVISGAFDIKDVCEGTKDGFKAVSHSRKLKISVKNLNVRTGGLATVLGVFVDYFGAMAEKEGIPLNDLLLALSKVLFDVAGAGTATVSSAFTGPLGMLFLAVSITATFKDSYHLGKDLMQLLNKK